MQTSLKTHSHDNLQPVLIHIRTNFYKNNETQYHRDKTMLLYALTSPAAWLHNHGLKTIPEHYQNILFEQLRQIRQHGHPDQYQKHFPRYLLKCLQQWLKHNHEQRHNQLKHLSYTIAQIAAKIENMPVDVDNHTTILAEAHEILRQNYRIKRPQPPFNQLTLGL